MAKSLRSKREKRLRAIRRDLVEPIYNKKEASKLAALEAALSCPKLPVKPSPFSASSSAMDITAASTSATDSTPDNGMEMAENNKNNSSLKPIGKKLKKKLKLAKNKRRGKGKVKRRHI